MAKGVSGKGRGQSSPDAALSGPVPLALETKRRMGNTACAGPFGTGWETGRHRGMILFRNLRNQSSLRSSFFFAL
jgi:hypothetical protein